MASSSKFRRKLNPYHRLTRQHPQQHRSISENAQNAQKTLQYTSTPLDFVFGIGLYLAPSDMALHPGSVQGYNNEIVIAGSKAAICHNPGINKSEQIGKTTGDNSFEGKIAAPAGTDHKGPPSGKPAADVAEQQGHAADVAEQECLSPCRLL